MGVYGLPLLVLPYFGVIWAFTTYAGDIAKPWTIGWMILWLIYSPIVTWSGVFVVGDGLPIATICFGALVVAVPFWPDAKWMLLTIFASGILGALYHVWMSITAFVAIVCGFWIWYHKGIWA